MAELSKAFENILPKIAVTGQSGSTAQYESTGGKAKKAKKGSKKAKKGSKKSAKKGSKKSKKGSKKTAKKSSKLFSFLGF